MKCSHVGLSVGIPLLLAGAVIAHQVPPDRFVQMKRLDSYLGTWKVKSVVMLPEEFKGFTLHGTLTVERALRNTALQFKATMKADDDKSTKTLEGMGMLMFNEADFYEKQQFAGSFAWSEDGRLLPLHGKYSGKTLVLEGQPDGHDSPNLRVKTVDKGFDVYVVDGKKEDLFLQVELSK